VDGPGPLRRNDRPAPVPAAIATRCDFGTIRVPRVDPDEHAEHVIAVAPLPHLGDPFCHSTGGGARRGPRPRPRFPAPIAGPIPGIANAVPPAASRAVRLLRHHRPDPWQPSFQPRPAQPLPPHVAPFARLPRDPPLKETRSPRRQDGCSAARSPPLSHVRIHEGRHHMLFRESAGHN
jgi:hypothetical protein